MSNVSDKVVNMNAKVKDYVLIKDDLKQEEILGIVASVDYTNQLIWTLTQVYEDEMPFRFTEFIKVLTKEEYETISVLQKL